MSNRNVVNGLATAGAVLVLVAVSSAASNAFAAEELRGDAARPAAERPESTSLQHAEQATEEAARDAAKSVASDNALDLEIRLTAHTSLGVARLD